jgi:hypothetical protein
MGILHRAVELGRIDIHLPVALMAQYLVQPHAGYLQQLFHTFAYIKAHLHSQILLDDTIPYVNQECFVQANWINFYPDACKALPPMPQRLTLTLL